MFRLTSELAPPECHRGASMLRALFAPRSGALMRGITMTKKFALAAALVVVAVSNTAMAQEKKSANFLSASPESQLAYIATSLLMAQSIVSKDYAACIGKWAEANAPSGYKEIIDTVKKYDDFHPTGVIAAVIKKACGPFQVANN